VSQPECQLLLVTVRELATRGTVSEPLAFWIASGLAMGGLLLAWVCTAWRCHLLWNG